LNTCKTSEEDDGTNNDELGVNNKNDDDDDDDNDDNNDNDNDNDNSEDQNVEGFERMVGIPEYKVASSEIIIILSITCTRINVSAWLW